MARRSRSTSRRRKSRVVCKVSKVPGSRKRVACKTVKKSRGRKRTTSRRKTKSTRRKRSTSRRKTKSTRRKRSKSRRKSSRKKMSRKMKKGEGYCVKCKAGRMMTNTRVVTMKNGRKAMKGVCPKCGTGMYRIM